MVLLLNRAKEFVVEIRKDFRLEVGRWCFEDVFSSPLNRILRGYRIFQVIGIIRSTRTTYVNLVRN